MQLRTDLAIESTGIGEGHGIEREEIRKGNLTITRIKIKDEDTAKVIGKSAGDYITIESLPITDHFRDVQEEIEVIGREIGKLLPTKGEILVVGLGNTEITPDALGPQSMKYILATRHIKRELVHTAGLEKLRAVSVIAPGVLGQTGIEVSEIVTSLVKSIQPSAVIVIDALAARELSRLGCTIQISDTGISPGSGVGNRRKGISQEQVGVPVIAIGVPTVVEAMTLAYDLLGEQEIDREKVAPRGSGMIVTPREIDLLIERAAKLVGMAVNCAVQSEYDFDTLSALVS